jgi:hypothetical protein
MKEEKKVPPNIFFFFLLSFSFSLAFIQNLSTLTHKKQALLDTHSHTQLAHDFTHHRAEEEEQR